MEYAWLLTSPTFVNSSAEIDFLPQEQPSRNPDSTLLNSWAHNKSVPSPGVSVPALTTSINPK